MAAPAVQNINDVISGLTAANQPVLDNLNQQDQNITDSASSGVAGINAAKDTAFSGITNQANARGALFSGFTPASQAQYTGSTYLPALAKLQQAITDSRTQLAGQKAGILSNISSEANKTVEGEKTALQQWQDAQDAVAAAAQAAQAKQQHDDNQLLETQGFTAGQNALNRSATAANAATAAANKAPTTADLHTSLQSDITNGIGQVMSSSTHVPGATETLIQRLQQAYPELDPKDIAARVYSYRSPLESKYQF